MTYSQFKGVSHQLQSTTIKTESGHSSYISSVDQTEASQQLLDWKSVQIFMFPEEHFKVCSKTSRRLLDGLWWDTVQTIMSPSGWIWWSSGWWETESKQWSLGLTTKTRLKSSVDAPLTSHIWSISHICLTWIHTLQFNQWCQTGERDVRTGCCGGGKDRDFKPHFYCHCITASTAAVRSNWCVRLQPERWCLSVSWNQQLPRWQ